MAFSQNALKRFPAGKVTAFPQSSYGWIKGQGMDKWRGEEKEERERREWRAETGRGDRHAPAENPGYVWDIARS